ncbi:MAG: DUF2796 domain-containing protein [Pseudomonadota bacterium]
MRHTAMLSALAAFAASSALAGESRSLGAHEHGVGQFNLAIEGGEVAMELEAPGADIVGFEHAARSEEDRAVIEAAEERLEDPLTLFVLPAEAGCEVAAAEVALIGDAGHDDHDESHDDHGAGHDHEHAEEEPHGHGEHAGHEDEEQRHTEFHAEYRLNCAEPSRLTSIDFVYFEAFPNAEELEVQMIGPGGSQGFEVTRDAPSLEIPGSS